MRDSGIFLLKVRFPKLSNDSSASFRIAHALNRTDIEDGRSFSFDTARRATPKAFHHICRETFEQFEGITQERYKQIVRYVYVVNHSHVVKSQSQDRLAKQD